MLENRTALHIIINVGLLGSIVIGPGPFHRLMNSRKINEIQYFKTFRMEVIIGMDETRRRHLIFATKKQLEILKTCHRWYVDGTFKLVRKPHFQLWSIHGFICKNGLMKQVII